MIKKEAMEVVMAEIKKGDVVELKSGGPAMTVTEIGPADNVKCIWFERGRQEEAVFESAVLKPHEKRGGFREIRRA